MSIYDDQPPFHKDLLHVTERGVPVDNRFDLFGHLMILGLDDGQYRRLTYTEQRKVFGYPVFGKRKWRVVPCHTDGSRFETITRTMSQDYSIEGWSIDRVLRSIEINQKVYHWNTKTPIPSTP